MGFGVKSADALRELGLLPVEVMGYSLSDFGLPKASYSVKGYRGSREGVSSWSVEE